MSSARVAQAKVCEDGSCSVGDLLVRGDHIAFVSTEQVRRVGRHKLDAEAMPSDVVLPASFVLVHDTTGEHLNRCEMFITRWRGRPLHRVPTVHPKAYRDAEDYFGHGRRIKIGSVDIPKGPWHRVAKVQFIRYLRVGEREGWYEHEFSTPVNVFDNGSRQLAWRLSLPDGCRVDDRGFVRP